MQKIYSILKKLHFKRLWGFPFIFICIFLICAHKYVITYFNTLTTDELLFFINSPMDGTDKRLVHIFVNKCILNPLTYALLICYEPEILLLLAFIWKKLCNVICNIIIRTKSFNINKIFVLIINSVAKYYTLIIVLLSLIILGNNLTKIPFLKDIIAMRNIPYGTFFEEHFVEPLPSNISMPQKKNLIIISVESLEKTFENKNFFGQSLLPHMEMLEKEGVQFDNYVNGSFTTYTAASNIAIFTGLPSSIVGMQFINAGHRRNLLSSYYSLGKILTDNGYETYAIQGSSGVFAGQKDFFETHGIQNFIDQGVIKSNYKKPINEEHPWRSYNDQALFGISRQILSERKSDAPYFMFIQTLDSHVNLLDPTIIDHKKFDNPYLNIIYNTNLQVYNFISYLKTLNNYKDTVIVIIGDHLRMGNNFAMPTKRQIYNLFLNTPKPQSTKRTFSQIDLFPTILEALGAEVKNHRLGLGTSLFSDNKTLLEEYSYSLGDKLKQRSKLNEKIWNN